MNKIHIQNLLVINENEKYEKTKKNHYLAIFEDILNDLAVMRVFFLKNGVLNVQLYFIAMYMNRHMQGEYNHEQVTHFH